MKKEYDIEQEKEEWRGTEAAEEEEYEEEKEEYDIEKEREEWRERTQQKRKEDEKEEYDIAEVNRKFQAVKYILSRMGRGLQPHVRP